MLTRGNDTGAVRAEILSDVTVCNAAGRGREHGRLQQLDQALDDATGYGWVLADMERDWKQVFPT